MQRRFLPTASFRAMAASVVIGASACSPNDLVEVKAPSGIVDVKTVQSYSGAIAAYNGALTYFTIAYSGGSNYFNGNYIGATGIFTDEFRNGPTGYIDISLDSRTVLRPTISTTYVTDILYNNLQYARVLSQVASDALRVYAPNEPALRGHAFALEGYTQVMLADFFCSGVPLSRVPLSGDFELAAGSTTQDIYEQALKMFDSTIALASDSTRVKQLAQIGRARVLLQLGQYEDAQTTVADIPTNFVYLVEHTTTLIGLNNFIGVRSGGVSVPNKEGINGMPWTNPVDPRITWQPSGSLNLPTKYSSGNDPVRLASGIEARLIEAESDLHAGGTQWLNILNALRTHGVDAVSASGDTTWTLGTGIVEKQTQGLRPLTDPGTATARLDLLFKERAFWLYATGQRQGDLRRLVRVYKRPSGSVYPTGVFVPPTPIVIGTLASLYGTDVSVPVALSEAQSNSRYLGCIASNE